MERRGLVALVDTSVWISGWRTGDPGRDELDDAVRRRGLATCEMVRLELLAGARSRTDMREIEANLATLLECPIDTSVWQRAGWVLARLAERPGGRHRSIPAPDLVIAAAAEAAELTVLHRDRHFELIASVTGQPTIWFGRPPAPAR